jgi:putative flippase GtrA
MEADPRSEVPPPAPDERRVGTGRFFLRWGIDVARLARFGAVSVITTVIDFGIFNLLVIPKLLPPVAATTISYSCGIVASFVLNKWFTFRGGRDNLAHELGLFVGINVVGLALNNGAVALAEHAAGGATLLLNLAKLGAGALTWTLKFLTFKHWVFPARESAASRDEGPA